MPLRETIEISGGVKTESQMDAFGFGVGSDDGLNNFIPNIPAVPGDGIMPH